VRALDEHLTIVSEAEKSALYGLPDFDDFQRAEYFALTAEELALAQRRDGLPGKITCILQIGYFKAKQAFFPFRLADIPGEDIAFLMRRYFPGQAFRPKPVRKEEYYRQRKEIFGCLATASGRVNSCRNSRRAPPSWSGAMSHRPSSSQN